jgi:subtilase family serine protease
MTTSYWAYKYADGTLSTIDESGKSYYKDLTKIYSAYSYIFYGMSYKRTVMSISRGDDYSFEDLNQTIINHQKKRLLIYQIFQKMSCHLSIA